MKGYQVHPVFGWSCEIWNWLFFRYIPCFLYMLWTNYETKNVLVDIKFEEEFDSMEQRQLWEFRV